MFYKRQVLAVREVSHRRPFFNKHTVRLLFIAIVGPLGIHTSLVGQQAGRAATQRVEPAPASKPRSLSEFTGYWVSVVTTSDWRLRMVTPAKGDFWYLRLTPEGIKVADAWDPAKDEAAGNQCKSYGAAGIMRIPGRFHITQPDEKTLRMDIDAGMQTRLFHFGDWKAPGGPATWQGDSVAQWDTSGSGGLKVTTTHMRPGYLRKNGVPYSENAVLTEYYDVISERSGDKWLILTNVVEDPVYLQQPYTFSYQFKKQADASGWDPSPCSSRW